MNPKMITKGIRDNLRGMKPAILTFCILLAVLVTLGSTLAWFTATDSHTNNFYNDPKKFFKVTVVDEFETPDRPGPNDPIYKTVGAWNTGEKPGFVRIMVIPTIIAEDGETALPANFGEEIVIDGLNTGDWIDGGDGYYYYKHILKPGENTDAMTTKKNLFSELHIAFGLGPEYTNATLNIEVKIEAVGITPSDEYIDSWWEGVTPQDDTGNNPLFDVHTALQYALSHP